MSKLTRRNFLGAAAVMAGGLTGLQRVVGSELHGRIEARADPGPSNPALDGQNPDSIWPRDTDSKSLVQTSSIHSPLPTSALMRADVTRGDGAELPVSKTLAGVNMRLTPGGFRELHCTRRRMGPSCFTETRRITAIDLDGKSFVADVGKK